MQCNEDKGGSSLCADAVVAMQCVQEGQAGCVWTMCSNMPTLCYVMYGAIFHAAQVCSSGKLPFTLP